MKKEYKKAFKELEKVFLKLQAIFEDVHHGQYFKNYVNVHYKEEKKHLQRKPAGIYHGFTVNEGTKYFAVKYLLDILNSKRGYTIKDILNVRFSAILAQSILENYPAEVKKAFEGVNLVLIDGLDYIELVKE